MVKKSIGALVLVSSLGATTTPSLPIAPVSQNGPLIKTVSVPLQAKKKPFVELTSQDAFERAVKQDDVVIVKFVADWSALSKDTTVDDKIRIKYPNVTFYTYSFIQGSPLALRYFIHGVPAYIGFKKGIAGKTKGQMDEQSFEDYIATLQNSEENPFQDESKK